MTSTLLLNRIELYWFHDWEITQINETNQEEQYFCRLNWWKKNTSIGDGKENGRISTETLWAAYGHSFRESLFFFPSVCWEKQQELCVACCCSGTQIIDGASSCCIHLNISRPLFLIYYFYSKQRKLRAYNNKKKKVAACFYLFFF